MDGPAEALKGFLDVVKMEGEKGEWCGASIIVRTLMLCEVPWCEHFAMLEFAGVSRP
jgi:hypothetical protein